MRTSRVAPLPLAAVLSAAALAGPAAASPASDAPGPPTWPTNPKPITSSQVVPHLPGPPTWPTDPQPITEYRGAVQPTGDGFDFEAGGIAVAVLVAGMAGAAGVRRRRRITRPRTVPLP